MLNHGIQATQPSAIAVDKIHTEKIDCLSVALAEPKAMRCCVRAAKAKALVFDDEAKTSLSCVTIAKIPAVG